jgi:hypothetical protein
VLTIVEDNVGVDRIYIAPGKSKMNAMRVWFFEFLVSFCGYV